MSDQDRQIRIAWIKQREKSGLSFLEIVNAYNATYGTRHFSEVFGEKAALPGKSSKTQAIKETMDNINTIFFGEP